ncbi:4-coumarate--CoA ligase family protein [Streptomyces sp. NPDC057638]|uniref:4-coumarate--CoA ligase family protein n=1 Tax=Streptomyces sp. NPDC057638 TaxID=3346190 RepID=UPI003685FB25
MVFRSPYADITPVTAPIHEYVLGRAAEYGDRTALVDAVTGVTVSYAQLDRAHRGIAAALTAAGLRPGDVLALHSPNTVAYPGVLYGATRAGAAVTTVHPLATAEEFAKQLRDSAARWIVTVSPLLEVARRAAELAAGIQEIFVCDRADGHASVLDMIGSTAPVPEVAIDPAEDIAVLPYSSGTTGEPKGVMLTHRSLATNLAQIQAVFPFPADERILAVLPFFHIYGLTALMNAPLRQGATVVVLPRFELDTFLSAIEEHRITTVFLAPPVVLAMAKHPSATSYDLGSLRHIASAAAPLDPQLAAACSERLGLPPVIQGYGMTELSPSCHIVPATEELAAPPGAVGRLLPSTEMRLLSLEDPEKDAVGGADGEIAIRGPQVMRGYLGRPEETAAMIDAEGWLRTGDIGRLDAEGWLYIVDRVKELIKYKGYQVAPAELEALLLTHPGIADAAVIASHDADGEEIPKAYVVRQPGVGAEDLTEEGVMAFVAARVSPYKKIRRVTFIGGVPRAASGKILRRELRERENI